MVTNEFRLLKRLPAMKTDKLFSNQALAEIVAQAPYGILLADGDGRVIKVQMLAPAAPPLVLEGFEEAARGLTP